MESQRTRHQDALLEIEAEENRAQELRRKLDEKETKEREWNSKIVTLEARLVSEQNGTTSKLDRMKEDLERYESKIKTIRREKNDALKLGESLRLKLRGSERETSDLEHQLHVVKSEEEWARRELVKVREQYAEGAPLMAAAERPVYAIGSGTGQNSSNVIVPTAGEMETLRRENLDLRARTERLTNAMETLSGSNGEKVSGVGNSNKSMLGPIRSKSRQGSKSRGSSRVSSRGSNRRSKSRGSSRGSTQSNGNSHGQGKLATSANGNQGQNSNGATASVTAGKEFDPQAGVAENEDPRREQVRRALAKRAAARGEVSRYAEDDEIEHQEDDLDHYANRGHGNGNGQYHHKPETSPLGNGEGGESMLTEAQQWAARQRLAREQHDDGRLNVVNGGGSSSMKKLRKMDEHGNTPSPMGKKRSSAAMARRAARAATSGV